MTITKEAVEQVINTMASEAAQDALLVRLGRERFDWEGWAAHRLFTLEDLVNKLNAVLPEDDRIDPTIPETDLTKLIKRAARAEEHS